MDVNDLRSAVTLLSLRRSSSALMAWAWSRRNRDALRRSGAACRSTATDERRAEHAMSDFFNSGWSIFIAVATVVGLVACLALLVIASAAPARWPTTTAPAMSGTKTCAS